MKFIDLFAGIGGFRKGMEEAGHKCVAFCEIDKFARESYKAIHDTKGEIELHDITKVTDDVVRGIGSIEVICGGFPCQAFSHAGKRRGFEDTRGTLFFEIARFASILKPKILFIENVKGLLDHDRGSTFETILRVLDEIGYNVEWQVCNSKWFGVPQNRERVFIIGHLRGECTRKVFPFGGKGATTHKEYRGRTFSVDGLMGALTATDYKSPKQILVGNVNPSGRGMNGDVFRSDGLSPTLTTRNGGNQGIKIKEATKQGYAEAMPGDSVNISHLNSETRRGRVGKQVANTLLTGEEQAVVTENYRIRKLTPLECWRLQGFSDEAFYKAKAVNSDSQLYKQAGNSVTVNVIYEIAKRL